MRAGKIKKARVATTCLHRFCADCIERWLRDETSGRERQADDIKYCPACRTPVRSRRDFRPDANFDQLMRALYGDVAEYEQAEGQMVRPTGCRPTPHLRWLLLCCTAGV